MPFALPNPSAVKNAWEVVLKNEGGFIKFAFRMGENLDFCFSLAFLFSHSLALPLPSHLVLFFPAA